MSELEPDLPDPGQPEFGMRPPRPRRPDPGRPERESRRTRRRRRAEQLRREIEALECELGIHCDEQPCTHWIKMESVW